MRLLLDANIIFAAAWSPEGRAAALVSLAEISNVSLLSSPHGIAEARKNIESKRPQAMQDLDTIVQALELVREAPLELVARTAERHRLPPGDATILAAAIVAGADVLVTGDAKDFGHLYGVAGEHPFVLPLRDALARVLAASHEVSPDPS
jgi:predicted nucleic acid-binding protein